MMFWGRGRFTEMEKEEPSAVRGEWSNWKKKRSSKNPYSAQGLDKFSTVLADLEARREKIIAKTGSQGVTMIRFTYEYDSSHDWVPIVIRPKEPKQQQQPPAIQIKNEEESGGETNKEKKSSTWSWSRWGEGYDYWTFVMVLILLSLVMFGKVFAICSTSVGWYMLPRINRGRRRLMMKKKKKKKINRNLVLQIPCN